MRLLAQRYEIREMSEYKDEHLLDAMEKLKTALDALDEYPKDHPGKLFLQYSFTAAAGELENRRRRSMLRAVH
jgi:hypothetical protein